ncbi:lysozyme inhibitor LprI family protein [Roseovarius sp.]|uniref:lysozyme inhibitor LprI family protein n=1 Tax=Roseovarius sp. TaxID=1486281 RepID=UPI003BA977B3
MRALVGLAFGLCAAASAAAAADIFRAEPITETYFHAFPQETIGDPVDIGMPFSLANSPHFRIEGRIEPGDDEKLEALLREELPDPNFDWSNNVVVSLNSDGGDFYEGLALADTIGGFGVMTFVGPGDRCLSSCAIAFMGGQNVMLRGMPAWPARYVHDEAIVGFHAPFSELPAAIQLPDGTPMNDSLMKQISLQFYGQAQAAINELTKRMSDWQLDPDFVFAMLTKESREKDDRPLFEQFVPIASFNLARQTKSTVLTSRVIYPETIGYLDALGACNFVLGLATDGEAFFLYGPNGRDFQNPDVITETTTQPYFEEGKLEYAPLRTNGQRFPSLEEVHGGVFRLVPGVDPEAFFFTTPTRGLGKAECSVFQFDDGRWYVKTFNQNVHHPGNEGEYLGNKVLDFESPVPISLYIAVGPDMTWMETPELVYVEADDLVGRYPEEIRGITEASFDCGGTLDPAAEIICEEPALRTADGRMVALFKWAREKDPESVLAAQRQWLAARDRACRPGRIDRSIPTLRRSLAQCLLAFTEARSRDLILGN